MVKRDHESFLDYAERLLNSRESEDLDYVEMYEMLFGIEISSTEARKRLYGCKALINALRDEGFENVTDEELFNKLHEKEIAAKKERVKLQTDKLEYNAWIREQSRAEMFEEKVVEALKNLPKIDVPKYRIPKKDVIERECVVGFGDTHVGCEFEIKGIDGKIINKYNNDIFESRMWQLLDHVVLNAEREGITHVHLVDLGDSISGLLHIGQIKVLRMGVVESIIYYSTFMRNWLNELSRYVSVDYYCSSGNHSDVRLLSSKKGDFPHENLERVLEWFLRETLRDNANIRINKSVNDGMNYFKVAGFDILAVHGQNEKNLEQSLKDYTHMYGVNIDYLISAHKHHKSEQTVGYNKEVIQIPSVVGTDIYSHSIKKGCPAGAKMMILETDYGSAVEYNIRLK